MINSIWKHNKSKWGKLSINQKLGVDIVVEAETKWPPFRRRHFQAHFTWEKMCQNFDYIFTVSFQESNQQYFNIVLENGLAPTRRQGIIWSNDAKFTDAYMRRSASMSWHIMQASKTIEKAISFDERTSSQRALQEKYIQIFHHRCVHMHIKYDPYLYVSTELSSG